MTLLRQWQIGATFIEAATRMQGLHLTHGKPLTGGLTRSNATALFIRAMHSKSDAIHGAALLWGNDVIWMLRQTASNFEVRPSSCTVHS
jgi:hypothetical protein